MYEKSVNAEGYMNDTCYFMFICKIIPVHKYRHFT